MRAGEISDQCDMYLPPPCPNVPHLLYMRTKTKTKRTEKRGEKIGMAFPHLDGKKEEAELDMPKKKREKEEEEKISNSLPDTKEGKFSRLQDFPGPR